MFGEEAGRAGPHGSLRERAASDPHGYWAAAARQLALFEPFEHVLEGDPPRSRWFTGARLNASYTCVDRHVEAGLGGRPAYLVEDGKGGARTVSYAELREEVGRFANALHGLGVGRGDVVAMRLPDRLELPVAMLAAARIGAVHLVFDDDAPAALVRDCLADAGASVLVSTGGAGASAVTVTMLRDGAGELRGGAGAGGSRSWEELVADEPVHCPPEAMGSEECLLLRYVTRPGGRLLGLERSTGGYLAEVALDARDLFELDPGRDVLCCAVPLASAAGHAYGVYGPLANAVTSVIGAPRPGGAGAGGAFELAGRLGVTVLSCATGDVAGLAREAGASSGRRMPELRRLLAIGERVDRDAFFALVGGVGDATCRARFAHMTEETGAVLAASVPVACGSSSPVQVEEPGPLVVALPGISLEVVDDGGRPVRSGAGHLTVSRPWPAMALSVRGRAEAYGEEYWGRYGGRFFAGGRASVEAGGALRLLEPGAGPALEA